MLTDEERKAKVDRYYFLRTGKKIDAWKTKVNPNSIPTPANTNVLANPYEYFKHTGLDGAEAGETDATGLYNRGFKNAHGIKQEDNIYNLQDENLKNAYMSGLQTVVNEQVAQNELATMGESTKARYEAQEVYDKTVVDLVNFTGMPKPIAEAYYGIFPSATNVIVNSGRKEDKLGFWKELGVAGYGAVEGFTNPLRVAFGAGLEMAGDSYIQRTLRTKSQSGGWGADEGQTWQEGVKAMWEEGKERPLGTLKELGIETIMDPLGASSIMAIPFGGGSATYTALIASRVSASIAVASRTRAGYQAILTASKLIKAGHKSIAIYVLANSKAFVKAGVTFEEMSKVVVAIEKKQNLAIFKAVDKTADMAKAIPGIKQVVVGYDKLHTARGVLPATGRFALDVTKEGVAGGVQGVTQNYLYSIDKDPLTTGLVEGIEESIAGGALKITGAGLGQGLRLLPSKKVKLTESQAKIFDEEVAVKKESNAKKQKAGQPIDSNDEVKESDFVDEQGNETDARGYSFQEHKHTWQTLNDVSGAVDAIRTKALEFKDKNPEYHDGLMAEASKLEQAGVDYGRKLVYIGVFKKMFNNTDMTVDTYFSGLDGFTPIDPTSKAVKAGNNRSTVIKRLALLDGVTGTSERRFVDIKMAEATITDNYTTALENPTRYEPTDPLNFVDVNSLMYGSLSALDINNVLIKQKIVQSSFINGTRTGRKEFSKMFADIGHKDYVTPYGALVDLEAGIASLENLSSTVPSTMPAKKALADNIIGAVKAKHFEIVSNLDILDAKIKTGVNPEEVPALNENLKGLMAEKYYTLIEAAKLAGRDYRAYQNSLNELGLDTDQLFKASERSRLAIDQSVLDNVALEREAVANIDKDQEVNPIGHEANNSELVRAKVSESLEYGIEDSGSEHAFVGATENPDGSLDIEIDTDAGIVVSRRLPDGSIVTPGELLMQQAVDADPNMDKEGAERAGNAAKEADRTTAVALTQKPKELGGLLETLLGGIDGIGDVHYDLVHNLYEKALAGSTSAIQEFYAVLDEISIGNLKSVANIADVENNRIAKVQGLAESFANAKDPAIRESIIQQLANENVTVYPAEMENPNLLINKVGLLKPLDRSNFNLKALSDPDGPSANLSFIATISKAVSDGAITLASLYSQTKDVASRHLFPVYSNTQHYSKEQAYSAMHELVSARTFIAIPGLPSLVSAKSINKRNKRITFSLPTNITNGSIKGGAYEIEIAQADFLDMFTTPGWDVTSRGFYISTKGTVLAPSISSASDRQKKALKADGYTLGKDDLDAIAITIMKSKLTPNPDAPNTYTYNSKNTGELTFTGHIVPIAGQMVQMYTAQVTPNYSITLPSKQTGIWKNSSKLPDMSGAIASQTTTDATGATGDEGIKVTKADATKATKDDKTKVGTKAPGVNPSFGTIAAVTAGVGAAALGYGLADDEAREKMEYGAMSLPLGMAGRKAKSYLDANNNVPLPTKANEVRTKTALSKDAQKIARLEQLFPNTEIRLSSGFETTKQFRESLANKEVEDMINVYNVEQPGIVEELAKSGRNDGGSLRVTLGSIESLSSLFNSEKFHASQEVIGFFKQTATDGFVITKVVPEGNKGIIRQVQADFYTKDTRPTPVTRAMGDGIPSYIMNHLGYNTFDYNNFGDMARSKNNPYNLEYTDEAMTGLRAGYGERSKTIYNVSLPTSSAIAKHYLDAKLVSPNSLAGLAFLNEKMASAFNLHLFNDGIAKILRHSRSEQKRRAIGAMQGQQLINTNSPIFEIHVDDDMTMLIPASLKQLSNSNAPTVASKWMKHMADTGVLPAMSQDANGNLLNAGRVYSSVSKPPYPVAISKPFYAGAFKYLDGLNLAGGVLSPFKKRVIVNYALYNSGTKNAFGTHFESMIEERSVEDRFNDAIAWIDSEINPNNNENISGEELNGGVAKLYERSLKLFKDHSVVEPYGGFEASPVPIIYDVDSSDPSYKRITENYAMENGGKQALLKADKKNVKPLSIVQNLVDMGDYVHNFGVALHDGSNLEPMNPIDYAKQKLRSLGMIGKEQIIDSRLYSHEEVARMANEASANNLGPVIILSQGNSSRELPNYFGGTPYHFGTKVKTDWPGAQVIGNPKLDEHLNDAVATKLDFLAGKADLADVVTSITTMDPKLSKEDVNNGMNQAITAKFLRDLSSKGLDIDAELSAIASVVEPTILPVLKNGVLFSRNVADTEHPGYNATRKLLGSLAVLFEEGMVPFNEDGTINGAGFVASLLNAFNGETKSNRLLDENSKFNEESSDEASDIDTLLSVMPGIKEMSVVESFLNQSFADLNDMYMMHLNRAKNLAATNTNESFKSKQLADMYQEEALKIHQARELLVPMVSTIKKLDNYLMGSKELSTFSNLESNPSLSPSNVKSYTAHSDYIIETIMAIEGGASSVYDYLLGLGYSNDVLNQFSDSELKLASILLYENKSISGLSAIDENKQVDVLKLYAGYGLNTFTNLENIKALYSTIGIATPAKGFDSFNQEDDLRVDARSSQLDEFGNPIFDASDVTRAEKLDRLKMKATYEYNPFEFKYFSLDPNGEKFSILKNNLDQNQDRAVVESEEESFTKKDLLSKLYSDEDYRNKLASKFADSKLFGDVGDQDLIKSSSFVVANSFIQSYSDDGFNFDTMTLANDIKAITKHFPFADRVFTRTRDAMIEKSKDGIIPGDQKTATILLQSALKELAFEYSSSETNFDELLSKLDDIKDTKLGRLIATDFTDKIKSYHAKSMFQTIKTIENFPKLYADLLLNHEGDVGGTIVANPKVFAASMANYRKWLETGSVDVLSGFEPKTIREAMDLIDKTTGYITAMEDTLDGYLPAKERKIALAKLSKYKNSRGQLMDKMFDLAIGSSISLSAKKSALSVFNAEDASVKHIKVMTDIVPTASVFDLMDLVLDLPSFSYGVNKVIMPMVDARARELSATIKTDEEAKKFESLTQAITSYRSTNSKINSKQVDFIERLVEGASNVIAKNTGYADHAKVDEADLARSKDIAKRTAKKRTDAVAERIAERALKSVKDNLPLVLLAGLSGYAILSMFSPEDEDGKDKPGIYDAGLFMMLGLGGKYGKGAGGKVYSLVGKAKPFSPLQAIESAEHKRFAEKLGALSTEKINYLDKISKTTGPIGGLYDIVGRFNRRFSSSAFKMSEVQKRIVQDINPRVNALSSSEQASFNGAYDELSKMFAKYTDDNLLDSFSHVKSSLPFMTDKYSKEVLDIAFDQAKIVHAIRKEAHTLGVNDTQYDPSFSTKEVNKELLIEVLNDRDKTREFVSQVKKLNNISNNASDIGSALNSILHRATRSTDITTGQLENVVLAVQDITGGNLTHIRNSIRKPDSDVFTETGYVGWKPFSAMLPDIYAINSQNAVIGKLQRAIQSIEAVKQFGVGFGELRSFLEGIKPSMSELDYKEVTDMISTELSTSFDDSHIYNTELGVRSKSDGIWQGITGLASTTMVRTNAFTSPTNNLAGLIGITSGYGAGAGLKALIDSMKFLSGRVKDPNDLLLIAGAGNQLKLDYVGALTSSSTNHKLMDSINGFLTMGLEPRDNLTTVNDLYNSLKLGMSSNQKMSFKKSLPGFIKTLGLGPASLFVNAANNSFIYAGAKLGQSQLPKAISNIAKHGTGWQSDLNEMENFLSPDEIQSLVAGGAISEEHLHKAGVHFASQVNGLTTGRLDKWEPKGPWALITQFMAIAANSFVFSFRNFVMPMAQKFKETNGNWNETAKASSRTAKLLFGGAMGTIALNAYKSAFGLNDYQEEELTNSSLAYRLYLTMATSQANVLATPLQYIMGVLDKGGLPSPAIGLGQSVVGSASALASAQPLKAAQKLLPYIRGATEFSMQDESSAKLFILNMMGGQSFNNYKRLERLNHPAGSLPDFYDAMTSSLEASKLGEPGYMSTNANDTYISKVKKSSLDELKKSVERINK